MKTMYACILDTLRKGNSLVEVTIIEQYGSAPRTAGAKMLVMHDASIIGTVGGGLYEAKAIDLAKTFFVAHNNSGLMSCAVQTPHMEQVSRQAVIVYFDLRGSHFPTDMDMVCGGELRLLVEYIPVTKENCVLYEALVQTEASGQACSLVTRVNVQSALMDSSAHYEVNTEKALFFPHTSNVLNLNAQMFSDTVNTEIMAHIMNSENSKTNNLLLDDYEYLFETLRKPYIIHVFGAGHVSCELAKISHYLDFKTVVLDDRVDFANAKRFPNVISLVLPSLDQACVTDYLNNNEFDSHDGVVIVTRGHARDRDVLAASLLTKAGYIGMIGSKSKRQMTYEFLLNNGYSKEDFEKIHSPIGLSIGAQTPQEIAISISAQLIQWRAGKI